MNSLSWLLFAAEFVGKLQGVFVAITILLSILLLIGHKPGTTYSYNGWYPFYALCNGNHKGIALSFVLCLIIAILIPSKELIYMIAASELGEQAVTSKDGQEIMNNLKEILKELTKPEGL